MKVAIVSRQTNWQNSEQLISLPAMNLEPKKENLKFDELRDSSKENLARDRPQRPKQQMGVETEEEEEEEEVDYVNVEPEMAVDQRNLGMYLISRSQSKSTVQEFNVSVEIKKSL